MTTAVVLLTAGAARTLTDNIKTLGLEIGEMLTEAHDAEAWKALGYKSWKAYVEAEFEFTRQRSYQLIRQTKVNQQLAAAGSDLRVSDLEAREVKTGVDTREITHEVEQRREIQSNSKPKRHGHAPLGLSGWLANMREDVDRLEGGFDMADDPIANLDHESRRDLERTATKCWEFWQRIIVQLAEPVEELARDEFESA